MPDTTDYSEFSPFTLREGEWLDNNSSLANAIENGAETINRREIISNGATVASGALRLTYFTAHKNIVCSKILNITGTTGAGATPTLIRMGLYEVAENGDLTLVASTPNDTTLFSLTFLVYQKAFSASYTLKAGQRYAVGILIVSTATLPTFYGAAIILADILNSNPRLSGAVTGLSDLPSSVAGGSVSSLNTQIYSQLLV